MYTKIMIICMSAFAPFFFTGCALSRTADEFSYQISGGQDVDPTANGSTAAMIDNWQYYILSDTVFETSRKDGYTNAPFAINIEAFTKLLLNNTKNKHAKWSLVMGSEKVKHITIRISPHKQGISVYIDPYESFCEHIGKECGYRQQFSVTAGKINWEDKANNDWIYGLMPISFGYDPSVVYADNSSESVQYSIPMHHFTVKIRKRVKD